MKLVSMFWPCRMERQHMSTKSNPKWSRTVGCLGFCGCTELSSWHGGRGSVPGGWETTTIVPIYKKRNGKECSNYPGISLHSVPCEVYTSTLNQEDPKADCELTARRTVWF